VANDPAIENKDIPAAYSAEPETLKPRDESEAINSSNNTTENNSKVSKSKISEAEHHRRILAYRPTHKATFIGIGVVILILGFNALLIGYLLKNENSNSKAISDHGVSISSATLSKLGVNNTQIGNSNEKLTINPAAQFNSYLTVSGNVSIAGQLHLNSTLNATSANLNQLQAGNTTVNSLNISGATTATTLSVRNNLAVNGAAIFQNDVTIGQLLSVDNNAAISNNLSVGGQISANSIAGNSLTVAGILTLGSHVITSGPTPSVSIGTALGGYGSASVYGNDTSGTINIAVGSNPSGGALVVHLAFHSAYSAIPVVVISPMGNYAQFYVSNVSTSGFDVNVGAALSAGSGYQINYIVEQ
jgi:hypothetical protein